ncbi:hypothetical protein EON65_46865 [archaeon]|nr:MAG: hypothetical protein EON65_46865 [archaeon]
MVDLAGYIKATQSVLQVTENLEDFEILAALVSSVEMIIALRTSNRCNVVTYGDWIDDCHVPGDTPGQSSCYSALPPLQKKEIIPLNLQKLMASLEVTMPRLAKPLALALAAEGDLVVARQSLIVRLHNLPEQCGRELNQYLSSSEEVVRMFHSLVADAAQVDASGMEVLAVSMAIPSGVLRFIPQDECNTYISIFEVSSFGPRSGINICKHICKLVIEFRDTLWERPNQRIMVLALSPANIVKLVQLYSDDDVNSSSWSSSFQLWRRAVATALTSARLLRDGVMLYTCVLDQISIYLRMAQFEIQM